MIIGPRYKIAKRLGTPVFEKTQTQKYAMRTGAGKDSKGKKGKGRPKALSEYGLGLLEKQKARYSYGITSKQFSKYVKKAIEKKEDSASTLLKTLESRLDNAVLRGGFATTRQAARQIVSHGHMTVNGKKVNIPSYEVKVGDVISMREGSKGKGIFRDLDERWKTMKLPAWLALDSAKKTVTVAETPNMKEHELQFDVQVVLEFYSR